MQQELMSLPQEVRQVWNADLEERVCQWIAQILENKKFIAEARKSFHQWEPLRVYINFTNARREGINET